MKQRTITLFILRDDQASQQAYELVKSRLDKGTFAVRVCPAFMAEDYTMPYIANEDQTPFFGLQGISHYLDHRQEFMPVLAVA